MAQDGTETIIEEKIITVEPGSSQVIAISEHDLPFDFIEVQCLALNGRWNTLAAVKLATVGIFRYHRAPLLFRIRYSQPDQFMTPDSDVMPQTARPVQSNSISDDATGSASSLT